MSFDLFNALELSSNDFLLFTNRDFISHQFVFDYLLQSLAKKGGHLLTVLLSNDWSHYKSVAAKCATNLTTLKDKQQLQVIDILSEEQDFNFERFSDQLFNRLSSVADNGIVLIDDLSLFLVIGVNLVTIYKFVHKLQVFCRQNNIILAIGTHFPSEECDEEVNRLVTSIAFKCDILCQIDKTSSGYSPLISGCLQIDRRHQNIRKEFNYKISDRSVKLLTSGSQLF